MITLVYTGGSTVITGSLQEGDREIKVKEGEVMTESSEDVGPQAEDCRQPLEAGYGKEGTLS